MGEDGETHHRVFDVAYLDSIPGMTVLAPASFAELEHMLERAVLRIRGPVAIRYPRGAEGAYTGDAGEAPWTVLRRGKDITLAGYGVQINDLLEASQLLAQQGVEAEVVKLNVITPLEPEGVLESVRRTGALLAAEECVSAGSVGQRLCTALARAGVQARVGLVNCGERFVPHGAPALLKRELGLDAAGIAERAMEVLGRG